MTRRRRSDFSRGFRGTAGGCLGCMGVVVGLFVVWCGLVWLRTHGYF